MSVASKNLFDLLGGENEGDSEAPRTAARGGAKVDALKSGARRGVTGNEAAYRDRGVGNVSNRGKPTEEAPRGSHRGGYNARVRGGRGSGHPRNRDDRHSKHAPSGSEKQAAQSWGAAEGQAELKDEQVGDDMAKAEKKNDVEGSGEAKDAAAEPEEPEEKHISYADYLAQQAEKKLAMESEVQLRKANEGTKVDKKWANAQQLVKNEEDVYFEGSSGKAKRERERKQKTLLDIDQRYVEPERGGSRGGPRGGGRGGRGRGRGDFRGRDGPRGGGSSGGGGPSGGGGRGRHGGNPPINPKDQSAFPSLGS